MVAAPARDDAATGRSGDTFVEHSLSASSRGQRPCSTTCATISPQRVSPPFSPTSRMRACRRPGRRTASRWSCGSGLHRGLQGRNAVLGAFAHQKAPHVVEWKSATPLRFLARFVNCDHAPIASPVLFIWNSRAPTSILGRGLDDLPGHRRQRQNERFVVFCGACASLIALRPRSRLAGVRLLASCRRKGASTKNRRKSRRVWSNLSALAQMACT